MGVIIDSYKVFNNETIEDDKRTVKVESVYHEENIKSTVLESTGVTKKSQEKTNIEIPKTEADSANETKKESAFEDVHKITDGENKQLGVGIICDGVLKITIHKAQCMENMDIIGKSDPFVEINFKNKKVKSETVKNTQFPEWNFSTQFDIVKNDTDNILVSIFDDAFGKTDFQGYITLSLHEAIRKAGKPAIWHDLIKNTWKGRVSISTEFFCSSHESTNLTSLDIESNKEGHFPLQKEKEKHEDDHKTDSREKGSEGTLHKQERDMVE